MKVFKFGKLKESWHKLYIGYHPRHWIFQAAKQFTQNLTTQASLYTIDAIFTYNCYTPQKLLLFVNKTVKQFKLFTKKITIHKNYSKNFPCWSWLVSYAYILTSESLHISEKQLTLILSLSITIQWISKRHNQFENSWNSFWEEYFAVLHNKPTIVQECDFRVSTLYYKMHNIIHDLYSQWNTFSCTH